MMGTSAKGMEVMKMKGIAWLAVILLLMSVSCGSKEEEKQGASEVKPQEVHQMHEAAKKAVEQKMQQPQHVAEQVQLLGAVGVWGEKPGTMGNAQGIMVAFQNQDTGMAYTAFVDPENRFKVTVTPGKYSLTINHPGYEIHQEEIVVDGRVNSKLLRPIGLKNVK
jgi:hypothetical protein